MCPTAGHSVLLGVNRKLTLLKHQNHLGTKDPWVLNVNVTPQNCAWT